MNTDKGGAGYDFLAVAAAWLVEAAWLRLPGRSRGLAGGGNLATTFLAVAGAWLVEAAWLRLPGSSRGLAGGGSSSSSSSLVGLPCWQQDGVGDMHDCPARLDVRYQDARGTAFALQAVVCGGPAAAAAGRMRGGVGS